MLINTNFRFFIILFMIFLSVLCNGQDTGSAARLFNDVKPLEIIIRTDLINLLNTRGEDPEYQAANIEIGNNPGERMSFDIKIQARGNFRRDSSNCDFPPIRLNFKKEEIAGTFFDGNEKIKIVTHCKTAVPQFDQFVAREYVTYRIYNLLTPVSFSVRPAVIIYEDTGNTLDRIERPGFLIEDVDHLAVRNNMQEYEEPLNLKDLEKNNAILLSLFQYMIGNTDWVLQMSKNLKTVSDGNGYYAVPYDFDYTLLVGADYSLGGGVSFLSDPVRIFKGPCFTLEELQPVAESILNKRKEIFSLISSEDLLDYDSKTHMRHFLGEFFSIIKSDKKISEFILSDCI